MYVLNEAIYGRGLSWKYFRSSTILEPLSFNCRYSSFLSHYGHFVFRQESCHTYYMAVISEIVHSYCSLASMSTTTNESRLPVPTATQLCYDLLNLCLELTVVLLASEFVLLFSNTVISSTFLEIVDTR